jgi:pyruvate dehydrogenase E2 component (dihydrolipoamide acetyltransferase)
MAIELHMPALSPTMETGTLSTWLVKVGDKVESGTIIAEIETDKATMEFESIDDGIVGKILVEAGTENVPVGQLIAVLLEEGENASALDGISAAPVAAAKPAAAEPVADKAPASTSPKQAVAAAPVAAAPAPAVKSSGSGSGDRVFASPLARRIAEQSGFDIAQVTGTGPHGRIIKRDVENYQPSAAAATSAEISDLTGDAPYVEVKLSNMRKTIAKRLTEST